MNLAGIVFPYGLAVGFSGFSPDPECRQRNCHLCAFRFLGFRADSHSVAMRDTELRKRFHPAAWQLPPTFATIPAPP